MRNGPNKVRVYTTVGPWKGFSFIVADKVSSAWAELCWEFSEVTKHHEEIPQMSYYMLHISLMSI